MRRSIATVGCLLLAVSCTSGPPPPDESAFVIGTTEPLGDLDPARCYEYLCAYVVHANAHEGLVRLEAGPSVRPVPALAERWAISEDGKTYTFRLRSGVRLHDGTRLTSELVERSLARVREAAKDDGPGFLLFDDVEPEDAAHGIVSVGTPAPDRVEIRLAAPDSSFLSRLAFPVASIVSAREEGSPAGAGPYAIISRTRGAITLERYEDHYGDTRGPDRVQVRFVRSADALRTGLGDAELHAGIREWSVEELGTLERTRGIGTQSGPGAAIRFLAFNTSDEPYDSVDIRRAIAAGVDRGLLVKETLSSTGRELRSLVPDGFAGARQVFSSTGQEAIESHLEETGVDELVALDLWYTPSHYGDSEQAVAETIERSLEGTGRFEVELHSAEWADYKASFVRGEYGMFLLGWFPDVLDPLNYLSPFMSAETAAGLGVPFESEKADQLLADGRMALNEDAKERAILALQELLADQVPYVPLWQPDRHVGVAEGVEVRLDMTQRIDFSRVEGVS